MGIKSLGKNQKLSVIIKTKIKYFVKITNQIM